MKKLVSCQFLAVSSWTVRSWTGLGLAACHFLDRQILDWVRVRVRVAVQELTAQELSGSRKNYTKKNRHGQI